MKYQNFNIQDEIINSEFLDEQEDETDQLIESSSDNITNPKQSCIENIM